MTIRDSQQEQRRLTELYSHMSDDELLKIFSDLDSLTDLAREALQIEVANRRLESPGTRPADIVELGDLTMLRRYRDLPEAMMVRGALESAGLECFLIDENMVRMDWFLSNLLGGVKLYVRSEEFDAAQQILREPALEGFDVEGMERFERPRCPQCDSLDIAFEELNKPVAYTSAYFSLPIPLHRSGWLCHSCKHQWNEGI